MVYCYNTETGEYAMTMPFETEICEGRTKIAPPETKDGQVAVFDEEKQAWEVFNDYRFTHKMIKDGEIVPVENFGEIPAGYELITNEDAEVIEEQIRIGKLTMTPLDFINFLVSTGLTLEEIDEYLNSNLSAKMQLTYCNNVYCNVVKKLMPVTIGEVEITEQMIEDAFKAKNGEI